MSRPSGLPIWNSGGTNNVEPSAGRKADGFATGGDTPGSGELNWWMEKAYRWIEWFDKATDGTLTDLITIAGRLVVTAPVATQNGITSTGNTTGSGISGTGGAASGTGVSGNGGLPNGNGGWFDGKGTGQGIRAEAENGSNGTGAYCLGKGSGSGVSASSQSTGTAVLAIAAGSGSAVYADSATGRAVEATANGVLAPIRLYPQGSVPSGASLVGDMYVTSAGVLKICTVAGTGGAATWVSVGTQT